MTEEMQVRLTVDAATEVDAAELDESARRLREELLALDVEQVEPVSGGELPQGAKAGEAVAWGAMLVTLAGSGGLLPAMVDTIRSWVLRHRDHTVTLQIEDAKLEISGASREQQQQLIDAWLHAVEAG